MRLRARLRGEEERRRSAVLGLLHRHAERRRHRPAAPALAARARCAPRTSGRKRGRQQRGKGSTSRGRADDGPRLVDKNALSARGGGPPRQSRSPSPDSPPAKRASSADSSGYDSETPDEVQTEGGGAQPHRVCGALGIRERFDAALAAGELPELLEGLPCGMVEASIRLMRGYMRTGKWPEPTLPSPEPERGRSRSSSHCPSEWSED